MLALQCNGRFHSIVLCGPHLIDQLTLCKVGDQIRLQRIVHLCGELLLLLHPAFQLCGKLCKVLLLPHHAGFVGALANIHAPAHKDLGLIAMQCQGRSPCHGRVCCGEVILQHHRHTACQIVQHRDAVQTHSQIEINVFPLQQAGHCITGIAAAFLLAIAKAMGKADLHLGGTHRIAQHAKHRHLCHGVAVDLELTDCLIFAVYHNEPLKIRLTALIGAFCFHLAVMVDAHNKDGGQIYAPAVGHAVHFHGLGGLLRQLRPGLRFPAALFQPAAACNKQQSRQYQYSQRRSRAILFFCVQKGTFSLFPSEYDPAGKYSMDCYSVTAVQLSMHFSLF